MIHSIRFANGYPVRLRGIGKKTLQFSERINVLFGPNGSGKSTILGSLAAVCGCGQGGWSEVPSDGRVQDPDAGTSPETLPFTLQVQRDREPVFYQDWVRNHQDSFIDSDYLERHAHLRSTGERRMALVNQLIEHIEDRFLTFKMPFHTRPTLLLDEVDNHIGFAGQSILWGDLFPRLSKKYQLIIASHSIFPILLSRPDSLRQDVLHVLEPGYAEVCVAQLGHAISHFNKRRNPAPPAGF